MANSLVNILLYKPPHCRAYRIPSRVIFLDTDEGNTIAATFIHRRDANVTILFSHGNGEDLNTSYSWMKKMSRDLNVHVMGYDYAGYGESTGTPTESNVYADIEAAYRYLVEVKEISPYQIVLYGRSLGSGPACYLAEKSAREGRSVAGLVLHSPFTSVYRVVVDFGFTMVGDQFSNIDRISNVQCPVLIIHGQEDEIVPFEHGRALFQALPNEFRAKPFWVAGMGHNRLGRNTIAILMARINHYLDYHILARRLWMLPGTRKRPSDNSSQRQLVHA